MKTISILVCLLAMALLPTVSAQVPKPKAKVRGFSNGYVGKSLPELEWQEGGGSRWLGTAKGVSLKKLMGKVVLVVLSSPP